MEQLQDQDEQNDNEKQFNELVIADLEKLEANDFNESDLKNDTGEESGPRRLSVEDLEENSKMSATMAVGILEAGVLMWRPQLEYDELTRAEAVEKLAPIFQKHGGELPPWLAAWQEELKAIVFFGGVAFSSYLQIKAANDADSGNDEKDGEEVG